MLLIPSNKDAGDLPTWRKSIDMNNEFNDYEPYIYLHTVSVKLCYEYVPLQINIISIINAINSRNKTFYY